MAAPDPVRTFADVARSLAEQHSVDGVLQRIVDAAVETVPGAEFASVSVVRRRRRVETVTATDDICRRVDDVQYETSEGPCLDAIWEADVVAIDDLAATPRWPHFARRAADIGIRSMLSFRLFHEEDTLGAINLYARAPAAFTDDSERLGAVFAAHAAVAWEHEKEREGLEEAMATRNLIGQAQGILMAQHGLDADKAFRLLVGSSQRRHRKLRDIAQSVVDTGDLPPA